MTSTTLVATNTVASRETVRRHSAKTPEVGCMHGDGADAVQIVVDGGDHVVAGGKRQPQHAGPLAERGERLARPEDLVDVVAEQVSGRAAPRRRPSPAGP